jgi:hypothetical protein
MKLPVRNRNSAPLLLIIEPFYETFEIPPGGEALVTLRDGCPHSIDVHEDHCLTIWNESTFPAEVVVFSTQPSVEPPKRPEE